jgi:hypothetical protein
MNSKDEQQSIRKDALQRIKSLRSEGLDRKEIVSILSSDFGIPESSGYRYFQQAPVPNSKQPKKRPSTSWSF